MQLNKGIAIFYRFADSGGIGDIPEKDKAEYHRGWYGERTVGFSRFFTAQQASTRVDMLIRVLRRLQTFKYTLMIFVCGGTDMYIESCRRNPCMTKKQEDSVLIFLLK